MLRPNASSNSENNSEQQMPVVNDQGLQQQQPPPGTDCEETAPFLHPVPQHNPPAQFHHSDQIPVYHNQQQQGQVQDQQYGQYQHFPPPSNNHYHGGSSSSSGGNSFLGFAIPAVSPHQRKTLTLICVVMAVATAFNVATMGYSLDSSSNPVGSGVTSETMNSEEYQSRYRSASGHDESSDTFYSKEAQLLQNQGDMEQLDGALQQMGEDSKQDGETQMNYGSDSGMTELMSDSGGMQSQQSNEMMLSQGLPMKNSMEQNEMMSPQGMSNNMMMMQQQPEQQQQGMDMGNNNMMVGSDSMMMPNNLRPSFGSGSDPWMPSSMMGQQQEQQFMASPPRTEAMQSLEKQQELIAQLQKQLLEQHEQIQNGLLAPLPEIQLPSMNGGSLETPMDVSMETPVDGSMGDQMDGGMTAPMEGTAEAQEGEAEVLLSMPQFSPEEVAEQKEQLEKITKLDGFKDSWDPLAEGEFDTPVFWHIPKAGGSTIKDIMGTCHRMCMASETGIEEGHHEDTEIAIVKIGGDPDNGQDPSPFVNVDTTTEDGLTRAINMGLGKSGLADVIVTPFIFQADELFDEDHKGRLFTLFRHPVDRAVSMFTYLQYADWEPTYDPKLAEMSISEYAKSPVVENNWMTRYLTQQPEGDLSEANIQVAMDIVRRKFLVGLLSKKEESMERFEKFFGWKYFINPKNQEKCRESLLGGGSNSNQKKMEKPQPGSEEYELLAWQNQFDIQLYEYIVTLFDEQKGFVEHIPDGYRIEGTTCCKCEADPCQPAGIKDWKKKQRAAGIEGNW
mmetsp:Transcript_45530/g.67102  ORF Transcript_45530/g.67102 Transcript_45530/m.67102 type:complete len:785 (-) Transcript_45530:275-2629(-)